MSESGDVMAFILVRALQQPLIQDEQRGFQVLFQCFTVGTGSFGFFHLDKEVRDADEQGFDIKIDGTVAKSTCQISFTLANFAYNEDIDILVDVVTEC